MSLSPSLARLASALIQFRLPSTPYTLSVGCGDYEEHPLLCQIWAAGLHMGLDMVYQAHPHFIHANAQKLPFRPACFNLILIRHPNLAQASHQWQAIFHTLPHYLAPQGALMVTVYDLFEADFVRKHLSLTRLKETRLVASDLVGHDRWIFTNLPQP